MKTNTLKAIAKTKNAIRGITAIAIVFVILSWILNAMQGTL
jgi:hypothetical protein